MVRRGDEIVNPRTGQRLRFTTTRDESDGEVLQIDCVSPPNPEPEPLHLHPKQESAFDVESGILSLVVDGRNRKLGPGEGIRIPPNTPHSFWIDGSEEVIYRQTFRPALRIEDFFDTYFALARDGKLNKKGMPNPLMLAVMGDAFWDEMRVTNPPPWVQRIVYTLLAPVGRSLGYRVRGNDSTD